MDLSWISGMAHPGMAGAWPAMIFPLLTTLIGLPMAGILFLVLAFSKEIRAGV